MREGRETMMCPVCRGTMRWNNERFVCPVCGYDDTPKLKPQTNADRIRAMTDEELAELIEKFASNTAWALLSIHGGGWLDWLKSPVEVDK